MYMMDGRENTNYSLVIPSLKLNHSGWYSCNTDVTAVSYLLLVCPESTSLTVFFSEGSEVRLSCDPDSLDAYYVLWFRNTDEHVLMDSGYNIDITIRNVDQRYNVSLNFTSLTISNLSQEDSGEYWCVRYTGRDNYPLPCDSLAKTKLTYKPPSIGQRPFSIEFHFLGSEKVCKFPFKCNFHVMVRNVSVINICFVYIKRNVCLIKKG